MRRMPPIALPLLAAALVLSGCGGGEPQAAAEAPVAASPAATDDAAAHDAHAASAEADAAATAHDAHAVPATGAEAHDAHAGGPLPALPAQPYATDEPLRAGMDGVARAVAEAATAQAGGTFDASAAEKLAARVDERFQYMVANCKLAPEADVALHALLAQLMAAARAAQEDPASPEAVAHMQQLLAVEYPRYFDHAGWNPAPAAP